MLYTIAVNSADCVVARPRRDLHHRRIRPCAVGRGYRALSRRPAERSSHAHIAAAESTRQAERDPLGRSTALRAGPARVFRFPAAVTK